MNKINVLLNVITAGGAFGLLCGTYSFITSSDSLLGSFVWGCSFGSIAAIFEKQREQIADQKLLLASGILVGKISTVITSYFLDLENNEDKYSRFLCICFICYYTMEKIKPLFESIKKNFELRHSLRLMDLTLSFEIRT